MIFLDLGDGLLTENHEGQMRCKLKLWVKTVTPGQTNPTTSSVGQFISSALASEILRKQA